ncbi:MAG: TPM domain-containing protein [Chloroflexi bacterium]|nr:TPM domain-containing protein [Chloroflexota bacterium]MBP8057071.1 TPM domain-containing protein [Chloroflexota bacterium]
MRQWFGWLLVGLLSVFILPTAQAQGGYPVYEDLYVNDLADVIDPEHETAIRDLLIQVYDEQAVEVTVLTIRSISDYDTGDETIESFATNLFNTWGIGDAQRNDGILLLVAIVDRELRIELGAGYGAADEDGLGGIIDRVMVPRFRTESYSLGIYEGTEAIVTRLQGGSTSEPVSALGEPLTSEPVTTSSSYVPTTDNGAIPWLAGGGTATVLGAGWYGLARFRRYRRRQCPACQITDMVRLDEVQDDAFLQEGQRLEESLKSVDYDVWQCPNCQHHEVVPYVAWFSRYKKCPQCDHRAMEVNSTVVRQPTYTSTGLRRQQYDCRNCNYVNTTESVIPRLQRSTSHSSSSGRSSSSSRSSFGGGRSSGGGRSGKW